MAIVNEYDPAADYNMVIRQGDTFSRTVTLTNGGTAIPNGTVALTVATSAGSTAVLSASGVCNGSGIVTLTASATQTAALDAGVYVYDLVLNLAGVVTTLTAGKFEVLAQV